MTIEDAMHPKGARWAAALIAASMGLMLGCGDEGTAESERAPDPPKPVQVEIVTPTSHRTFTHVPGVVEAASSMSLSFRVPGTVDGFAAEEGEYVERGELIATLDRRDYVRAVGLARAALAGAEARAADAERELDRAQRLRSSNSNSARSLDSARSSHQVAVAELSHARLELEAAETSLEDCTLEAPVSGYLEQRLIEKHEFATPEVPVAVLTELDTVKVMASVADRALSSLGVGTTARLQSSAWPGRVFGGEIVRVAMAADAATHTLPIEIAVANPDLALRPAMVVEVELEMGEANHEITVPMNAVLRDGALRTISFVVSGDHPTERAAVRLVTLGKLVTDRVVITSGLREGDRLIVQGQHFLRDGDGVRITEIADPSPEIEAGS